MVGDSIDNRPIGIFDSGVGGLTVFDKIRQVLPNESLIYVGDTANAPYGGKNITQLLKYGKDIIKFLQGCDVKAVVMACGTTSSTIYEELVLENPDLPMVDVIRPGVRACAEMDIKTLGLIATTATIKSDLFGQLIKEQNPKIDILTQVCPMFAPMIEAGIIGGTIAKWVVETYIAKWRGKIDALVFGCTHYPIIKDIVQDVLGENMHYIDLGTHTARKLKTNLEASGTRAGSDNIPRYDYYVSGEATIFVKTARLLLHEDVNVKKVVFD